MRRIVAALLVVGLFCLSGAHWGLVQAAAWAGMALRGEDGPCRACLAVKKAVQAESATLTASQPAPVEMYVAPAAAVAVAETFVAHFCAAKFPSRLSPAFSPPSPPPRLT